jgi:hypothetical protein
VLLFSGFHVSRLHVAYQTSGGAFYMNVGQTENPISRDFPIRIRAFSLYLFCVFIAFLAGAYFDQYLYMLFVALIFYPVVSILVLFVMYFKLRFFQNFSTEHPVKGEIVKYTINFTNELPIPFPCVNVRFKTITPLKDISLPEFSVYIKGSGKLAKEFDINCPYRGIYTVGLERVMVEDLLRFFRLNIKVWYKTFYVYPRILPLTHFTPGIEAVEGGTMGLPFGGEPDYSLFDQLREYRPGDTIRHIYWKKFAIIGKPFLKEYDTTPQPSVTIYFDINHPEAQSHSALEIEDTSVEILVSLVKYFLDNEIETSVRAAGRDFFDFTGRSALDFKSFYELTTNLMFQETIPLSGMFRIDERSGAVISNSVFFITHTLDADLFNLVQASLDSQIVFTIIFNQSGYSEEEKERNLKFFYAMKNHGARIIPVNSPASIVEDLERDFHE